METPINESLQTGSGTQVPVSDSKAGMIVVAVSLFVIGLIAGYLIGKSATPTSMVFTGTRICLSHRDPNVRTEECAIGLQTGPNTFYSLKYKDRTLERKILSDQVKITGKLIAEPSEKYISDGVIWVETIDEM